MKYPGRMKLPLSASEIKYISRALITDFRAVDINPLIQISLCKHKYKM